MYINSQNGEVIVHTGTMFGGKTSALVADVRKCEIAGLKVLKLKPKVDKRYSKDEIKTHLGDGIDAITCNKLSEVRDMVRNSDYDIVAIDEFQFLELDIPLKGFIVTDILMEKRKLIVSGLVLDRYLDTFVNMEKLLPYATTIHQHKSICRKCHEPAHYVYFTSDDNEDSQVAIGGADKYSPRCFNCYEESIRTGK